MQLPTIHGLIRRRYLVNFRVDAQVMANYLPAPFRPKLHGGYAIAGICLIRLEEIRPARWWPSSWGLSSENAAHRIAVTWTQPTGEVREGVFIPRRDTGSWLNCLAGGRVFPGEHHHAHFSIEDHRSRTVVSILSDDGKLAVELRAHEDDALPSSSCFSSVESASAFFEEGSVGYSVTHDSGRLDGIQLQTDGWRVRPLTVEHVQSSFFADERRFPPDSVIFDHALIMRNLRHEWHSVDDLICDRGTNFRP